jgi:hypothetical protein
MLDIATPRGEWKGEIMQYPDSNIQGLVPTFGHDSQAMLPTRRLVASRLFLLST